MPDPATIERPWIAHYPPGVPPTYRYPDVALTRFLDDAARDFPDVAATRFRGVELSYADLLDRVDRFASALADLGVQRGDRVAVILPNLPASVIATFATFRLGAVLVPLDPADDDLALGRALDNTDAVVAVALSTLVPRLVSLQEQLPGLRHIIATAAEEWLGWRDRILAPLLGRRKGTYRRLTPKDGALSMTDLIDDAAPIAAQEPVTATDLAVLQHTGGTTGERRAVMLTHGSLVANSFQARLWVPDIRAGKERLLAVLPFFHVYGFTLGIMTAVLSAGTLVLLPRFDVDEVLDTIDREHPTLFPGVPMMYRAIATHPEASEHELKSIRACVSGGAPLPVDIARRFEEITGGARLREGYGLTETSPLTHANPIYGRNEQGRIGLPVTDTVAIVVDPEDRSRRVDVGQPGELAVAGPQLMAGYWRDEAATAEVMRDGWLLTGDIVIAHEDGSFTHIDRGHDVVTTGGMDVYPRDVERVLMAHPAVAQAAAIGLPDDEHGECIKAFVVLRPRATAPAAELAEHCRQHLAGHEVPTDIELRDSLPESSVGKVKRRDLADEERTRRAEGDTSRFARHSGDDEQES